MADAETRNYHIDGKQYRYHLYPDGRRVIDLGVRKADGRLTLPAYLERAQLTSNDAAILASGTLVPRAMVSCNLHLYNRGEGHRARTPEIEAGLTSLSMLQGGLYQLLAVVIDLPVLPEQLRIAVLDFHGKIGPQRMVPMTTGIAGKRELVLVERDREWDENDWFVAVS